MKHISGYKPVFDLLPNGDVEVTFLSPDGDVEVQTKLLAEDIRRMSPEVQEAYSEFISNRSSLVSLEVEAESSEEEFEVETEESLDSDSDSDSDETDLEEGWKAKLSGIQITTPEEWEQKERLINRKVFECLQVVRDYKRISWIFFRKDPLGFLTPESEEAQDRLIKMGVDPDSPDAAWQYAAVTVSPIWAKAAQMALRGVGKPPVYAPGGWELSEGKGWLNTSLDFHTILQTRYSDLGDDSEDRPAHFNQADGLREGMMDELFGSRTAYRADWHAGRYHRSDRGNAMYDGGDGVVGYWDDADFLDEKRQEGMIVIPYIYLRPEMVGGKRVFPRLIQPYFKRREQKDPKDITLGFKWVDGYALDVNFISGDCPKPKGWVKIWTKFDHFCDLRQQMLTEVQEASGSERTEKQLQAASLDWWFRTIRRCYLQYVREARIPNLNGKYEETVNGKTREGLDYRVHYRSFSVQLETKEQVFLALYPTLLSKSKEEGENPAGSGVSTMELAERLAPRTIRFCLFSKMSEFDMVDRIRSKRMRVRKDRDRSRKIQEAKRAKLDNDPKIRNW